MSDFFLSDVATSLFQLFYPDQSCTVVSNLVSTITSLMDTDYYPSGMDGMFIPYVNGDLITWLIDMLSCVFVMSSDRPSFSVATLWVPNHYYTDGNNVLTTLLPPSWPFCVKNVNSAIFWG